MASKKIKVVILKTLTDFNGKRWNIGDEGLELTQKHYIHFKKAKAVDEDLDALEAESEEAED